MPCKMYQNFQQSNLKNCNIFVDISLENLVGNQL